MGKKSKETGKRKLDSVDSDPSDTHEDLANTIKSLHWKLRKEYRQKKSDYEAVWKQHSGDEESLTKYAAAMHKLATCHWETRGKTRIDWCRDTVLVYFRENGLETALAKDERRRVFKLRNKEQLSPDQTVCDLVNRNSSSLMTSENSSGSKENSSKLSGEHPVCNSSVDGTIRTSSNFSSVIDSPPSGKIRLLDVGSCYNPFLECSEFESTAIDLCPATPSVHKCDFLSVSVSGQPVDSVSDITSPVTSLPHGYFHVVVFSLLLEYMPSSLQRWKCCRTAHQLLPQNGLLVIITPDSNNVNKNAPMLKSWKSAIESLGFRRWKYEKQTHLHCMAFRKIYTGN